MRALQTVRQRLATVAESQSAPARLLKRVGSWGIPVPEPLRAPVGARRSLAIAPFNYAGQARQWARTVSSTAGIPAANLAVSAPGGYGFAADAIVPARVFLGSRAWQRAQRAEFERFSHLLIESFTSPLGSGRGAAFRAEIAALQRSGVRVGFIAHGSDVRSPSALRERSRFSPFDPADPATAALEARSRAAKRLIEDTGLPVFVSTPDLLHDVPTATWLPLVVDGAPWRSAALGRTLLDDGQPRVLHAPTHPRAKGSVYVEAAMRALAGEAEYLSPVGVPAAEMPALVASADIVVDQLILGSYGVAACEALAAGRVVVGNVDAGIREQLAALAGVELPIVQADPDSVAEVLGGLVGDRQEIRRIGALGPEFVESVHSGTRTAAALAGFFEESGR